MLNPLMDGIAVMAYRRSDTGKLIRGNAYPDAAAAR